MALCELGVDPTDRATFENAKHVVGYDYTWGWLRAPANSQAQLYLATHPALYRLYVGLYARLLLGCERYPPGIADEAQAVRCCLELRLQLYNTKIALPKDGGLKFFSHLDCDWRRGGCTATPAPQCLVATSPQHVGSTRVFSARFVDVEAEVRRHELAAAEPVEAPPRKRRRIEPYRPPPGAQGRVRRRRTHRAGRHRLWARNRPGGRAGRRRTLLRALGRPRVYTARDAERAGGRSGGGLDITSARPLPIGLTRTAEYPTLVAPWIHGEPHQSKDEVLCAPTHRHTTRALGACVHRQRHGAGGGVLPFGPPAAARRAVDAARARARRRRCVRALPGRGRVARARLQGREGRGRRPSGRPNARRCAFTNA